MSSVDPVAARGNNTPTKTEENPAAEKREETEKDRGQEGEDLDWRG